MDTKVQEPQIPIQMENKLRNVRGYVIKLQNRVSKYKKLPTNRKTSRIQYRGLNQDTSCLKRTILAISSPTMHNYHVTNRLREVGTFMNRREGGVENDVILLQHMCSAILVPLFVVKWASV